MTVHFCPTMKVSLWIIAISLHLLGTQSQEVHRPSAGVPQILSMPDLVYVDDQDPITLTCTVTRDPSPIHVSFRCGEKFYTKDIQSPDLTTQTSKVYSHSFENSVITEMMETSSTFTCVCQIFSASGNEILSEPTEIKKASLEQKFFLEPKSQVVKRKSDVRLRCEPPYGDPKPRIRWERNGKAIQEKDSLKYQFAEKGSILLIQSFLEEDVGNYTCIAFNIIGTVRSRAAKLDISYNENWGEWQGWGECDSACGKGLRVRYRRCWNQDLNKPGTECFGQATESERCEGACKEVPSNSKDFQPGVSDDARNTDAFDNKGGVNNNNGITMTFDSPERKKNERESERRDQAVMVGVITSIVMFVVIALVVVLVLYRKSRSIALHKAYPSGRLGSHIASVYSPNSIVVSKHGETEIIATMPPCSNSMMSTGYHNSSGQPMYFVDPYKPVLGQSYPVMSNGMSPGSAEVMVPMIAMKHNPGTGRVNSLTNVADHYSSIANDPAGLDGEYQIDDQSTECGKQGTNGSPSKKYERLSNSSAADDDQMAGGALEQGLGGRCLIASKRFYESQNEILQSVIDDKFVIATFTSAGGRLCLPRSGVSLLIPEGAIPPNKTQEVYLAISNEDRERPKLPEGGTILSPIIVCGPSSSHFLRPVVLSFAHSALNPLSDWTISVLNGTTVTRSAWQNLLILGEENLNSTAFCQMDEDRCHLLIDSLHDKYCLVGKSKGGKSAVKRLLLSAFAPSTLRCQEYNIRIYCVDDTQDALENVIDLEKKCGGVMMDCCKLMHFRDHQDSGLHLALTELSMGWRCKVSNHQQNVPFNHIWCAVQSSLHASFSLEQPNRNMNCLETKIEAFQIGSYDIHCFTVRLSVSDSTLLRRSMMDLTPTGVFDPPGLVFRLPIHVRSKLCQTMDAPSYAQHDWIILAKKLNCDRYMNYFASKSSPTSHILDLWEARNRQDSAVRELICAVKSMGKHELAHFIEVELGNRVV